MAAKSNLQFTASSKRRITGILILVLLLIIFYFIFTYAIANYNTNPWILIIIFGFSIVLLIFPVMFERPNPPAKKEKAGIKVAAKAARPLLRNCPHCGMLLPAAVKKCPNCGTISQLGIGPVKVRVSKQKDKDYEKLKKEFDIQEPPKEG